MKTWKKVLVMVGLVAAILVSAAMYWSQHLYYRARDVEDPGQRVELLEAATKFNLTNDWAFYEMGKAYFDLGYGSLGDPAVGESYLKSSKHSFERSLMLNPAHFYSHYNYAQTLFYMDYLLPSAGEGFVEEYRKAAELTGHRSEIYFQVGKLFLSQWHQLSEEDKEFAIEILKTIAGKGDKERFDGIMHTWVMDVGDYGVMGQILPDDSRVLRRYGEFLGTRSLSREERHQVLARAEHLEYERAEQDFSEAENLFRKYRMKDAGRLYSECLGRLEKIKLYQVLTGKAQIDVMEFNHKRRDVYLKLAECAIESGQSLREVEVWLRDYLDMVDIVSDVSQMETYLVDKGLIGEKLEESVNDLGRLNFHSLLYFKQSRHRDIKNVGGLLQRSYVVVPEEGKENYVEVLRRVADSHQITGNSYDASDFYERALEVDEDNVKTLLGLRRNLERLNEEEEIRKVDRRLERLLSPREIDFGDKTIGKGQRFVQTLVLDGRRINLGVEFNRKGEEGQVSPLVSVVLNGRVVWEDYLSEGTVILMAETQEGENRLEIRPINCPVTLTRITLIR